MITKAADPPSASPSRDASEAAPSFSARPSLDRIDASHFTDAALRDGNEQHRWSTPPARERRPAISSSSVANT